MEARRKIKKKAIIIRLFAWVFTLSVMFSAGLNLYSAFVDPDFNWDTVFRAVRVKTPLSKIPDAKICFLDIGQSDSTLIKCNDKAILIDAGAAEDAGQICCYLEKYGVEKLDYVIITHPHSDHCGGLPELMKYVSAGVIYMGELVPQDSRDNVCYNATLEQAEKLDIPVRFPADHQKIILDGGVIEFYVTGMETKNENNKGLIVYANFRDTRLLFMGDNGSETEEFLINHGYQLSADILHVGHHGSKTATTSEFLKAVAAKQAFISFGTNSYGHPAKEVLENLKNAGTEYYYAYNDRLLSVDIFKDRYEINTEITTRELGG